MERVVVVETTSLAWKARVIPLYDTRMNTDRKKTPLTQYRKTFKKDKKTNTNNRKEMSI